MKLTTAVFLVALGAAGSVTSLAADNTVHGKAPGPIPGAGGRGGAPRKDPPATAKPTDITIQRGGLTIGGMVGGANGKFVGWGSTVQLTEQDSTTQSNGTCAFNISYPMQEAAGAPAGPTFVNRLRVDDQNVVSTQSALSLLASEGKIVNTQAYLPAGSHKLVLFMDDDRNIVESNEGNNNFQINFVLSCGKP